MCPLGPSRRVPAASATEYSWLAVALAPICLRPLAGAPLWGPSWLQQRLGPPPRPLSSTPGKASEPRPACCAPSWGLRHRPSPVLRPPAGLRAPALTLCPLLGPSSESSAGQLRPGTASTAILRLAAAVALPSSPSALYVALSWAGPYLYIALVPRPSGQEAASLPITPLGSPEHFQQSTLATSARTRPGGLRYSHAQLLPYCLRTTLPVTDSRECP